MNPLFWIVDRTSLKKELMIVGAVLITLTMMPIVVFISVANVDALSVFSLFDQPANAQVTYDYGWCTYWAALRRLQVGSAIPNTWGNANTWAERAQKMNYLVDHTPSAGAIMQTTAGKEGHVAYVESVNPITGEWTISEMNWVGWDIQSSRTLKAADATKYNFIHEQQIVPGLDLKAKPALGVSQ